MDKPQLILTWMKQVFHFALGVKRAFTNRVAEILLQFALVTANQHQIFFNIDEISCS